MTTQEYEAKCALVVDLVEKTVRALIDLGLTKQGALSLLVIQSALRTESLDEMRDIRGLLDHEIGLRETCEDDDDDGDDGDSDHRVLS